MATTETRHLDNIIATRRSMLLGGGAVALAAMALPGKANAAATVSAYTDNDILNFALNLEYLEANFYYLAAFGTTINTSNSASTAAGASTQTITGTGTQGSVTVKSNAQVPFLLPQIKSYAIETAIEEGKHVAFLRSVLGSAAVAQPAIDLQNSFNGLATLAGLSTPFDPFSSDANFLLGAYIFEDVGVTAYKGAAPLISQTSSGKTILQAAGGILAVEAYHAGNIRTAIYNLDPNNTLGYLTATQKISAARAAASKTAAGTTTFPTTTYGDDVPLTTGTTVSLAGTNANASTIADADLVNQIAFSRTTTQVLNIVTAGGALTAGTKATGGFFPAGLNGTFV